MQSSIGKLNQKIDLTTKKKTYLKYYLPRQTQTDCVEDTYKKK